MYGFLGDELVNKIKHLSSLLNNANTLIYELEKENQRLYDLILEPKEGSLEPKKTVLL